MLFCRQKAHYINMCSLHVLVIHLCLSTGAAEKPYFVEEAVSYNELDYISVSVLHNKDFPFSLISLIHIEIMT